MTEDLLVLSAGPTPHTPPNQWTFSVDGAITPKTWTWEEFRALPSETVTLDINCVTRWSKLDTAWEGVSLDTLLGQGDREEMFVMTATAGTPPTCRFRTCSAAGPGSRSATEASRCSLSTAARRGCWSLIVDWVAETTGLLAAADSYLLIQGTLQWTPDQWHPEAGDDLSLFTGLITAACYQTDTAQRDRLRAASRRSGIIRAKAGITGAYGRPGYEF